MAHASLRGSCLREAIFPLPTLTLHLSGTTVTSSPDVNTTTGNPANITRCTHHNIQCMCAIFTKEIHKLTSVVSSPDPTLSRGETPGGAHGQGTRL